MKVYYVKEARLTIGGVEIEPAADAVEPVLPVRYCSACKTFQHTGEHSPNCVFKGGPR